MFARDAFVARLDDTTAAICAAADVLAVRLHENTDTLVRENVDTLEHLDWQPRCEGLDHNRGLHGHQPEQSAAYVLIAPCHGPRLMICAARRNYLLGRGLLRCNVCKVETLVERWRMEPIGNS